MTTVLIIIFSVLIIAPWCVWSYLKAIKKTKGYQVWFKKTLLLSFAICYFLAIACLVAIVLLITL